MNERDIIENIWEILKVYIPDSEKEVAAEHLVPFIVDLDLPASDFAAIVKSDAELEAAAADYLDEDEDDIWD